MSRAFVKESDQEEAPVIPARAALPAGVNNYVTPEGLAALRAEADQLEKEKAALNLENEDEQRRALTVLNGKLALLLPRIASAQVIDPANQPADEVRFGARITVKDEETGKLQSFRIVGVDEADVRQQKIAFVSPMARAVTGLWVNETAELRLGKQLRKLLVTEISYQL